MAPSDDRTRRLIVGLVIALVILVGGTFLLIGLLMGDETDDDGSLAPRPADLPAVITDHSRHAA